MPNISPMMWLKRAAGALAGALIVGGLVWFAWPRPVAVDIATIAKKPMQVTVVTLLVNPEQAERLALASTEGKIQLALRNPLDQGAPDTPGIRTAGLMGGKPAPAGPAPRTAPRRKLDPKPQIEAAPAPAPSVEIIRGDKRSTEIIK